MLCLFSRLFGLYSLIYLLFFFSFFDLNLFLKSISSLQSLFRLQFGFLGFLFQILFLFEFSHSFNFGFLNLSHLSLLLKLVLLLYELLLVLLDILSFIIILLLHLLLFIFLRNKFKSFSLHILHLLSELCLSLIGLLLFHLQLLILLLDDVLDLFQMRDRCEVIVQLINSDNIRVDDHIFIQELGLKLDLLIGFLFHVDTTCSLSFGNDCKYYN